MATRRESVTLDLEENVSTGMLKVAAATEVADQALEHMGGQQTKASKTTRQLESDTGSLSQRLDRSGSSLDKYSGRLGILLDTLAAVGPATVPIAAEAIPLVATFANNLGALALGAGVTELAFHGLGSTLEKFNKAEAAPTAANIAAAQAAMDALPPSSQRLVLELSRLSPVLDKLRQDAAGGFVPGVTAGIHSLLTDSPLAERAIRGVSGELGEMARETGKALASDEWRPFLKFIGQDAPGALHTMGQATGDVAHGLAQILMDFGPTTDRLDAGVLRLAQDFDQWATSLGKTHDFQAFIEYVETNGPKVEQFLGDVSQLFIDIVQAAAPLGGPTLQALDDLAKILDEIATSPLATPLIAMVQALSLARLATRGFQSVTSATFGAGGQQSLSAYGSGLKKNIALWRELNAVEKSSYLTSEEAATRNTARSSVLSVAGKGALAGGVLALASTGVAQKLGLTNTATYALTGALVGGAPGAIVGGLFGAVQDVAKAEDGLSSATQSAQAAMKGWDLRSETRSLAALSTQIDDFRQKTTVQGGSGLSLSTGIAKDLSLLHNAFFGNSNAAAEAQYQSSITLLGQQKTALAEVYQGLSGKPLTSELSTSQLQATLTRVQPAMQALGVTTSDLASAAAAGGDEFSNLVNQLVNYTNKSESTSAKTHAVAQAFASMSNDALTADQRVANLQASLSHLLDPKLNVSAAADAWRQGLNDLSTSLSKTTKGLIGQSDAVIQNRGVIRQQVTDLEALINAEAAAGQSPAKMTAQLKQQRQALIEAGTAAGISKGELEQYLDKLGLTPKLVTTVVQAQTGQAMSQLDQLQNKLNTLHDKTLHVNVFTNATVADPSHLTPPGGAAGGTVRRQRRPGGAAGRIVGYADGGSVGRNHPGGGGTDLKKPLFTHEGPRWYKAAYKHGFPFAKHGPSHWDWPYQTGLDNDRQARDFERWVNRKHVPFDTDARHVDYDMRGYWKKTKGQGWHHGEHFPDTWKTPYDTTFSNESKYATNDNPFYWHGQKLIDERTGQVVFAPAADGWTIPGQRMPYGDKVLIWAAPGEEIITNRNGEADQFRADRAAGAIPAYADGGTPLATHTTSSPSGSVATLGSAAAGAAGRLHDLSTQSAGLQKQIAAEQKERQSLVQAEQQLASTVRAQFMPQIFGVTPDGGIWASGATTDPAKILKQAIRQGREYTTDIRHLHHDGLTRGALAQVQTLAEAQQAVGLPRGELAEISRLFRVDHHVARRAGQTAGQFRYGEQLDTITGELRGVRAEERRTNRELAHLRQEQKKNAKATGDAVATGLNRATRRSVRRARGGP